MQFKNAMDLIPWLSFCQYPADIEIREVLSSCNSALIFRITFTGRNNQLHESSVLQCNCT